MATNSVPSSRSGLPIHVKGSSPMYHSGPTSGVKTNRSAYIPSARHRLQIDGSEAPAPVANPINLGAVSAVRGAVAGFGAVKPIAVGRKPGQVPGGVSPNTTAQSVGGGTGGGGTGAGSSRSGGQRAFRGSVQL